MASASASASALRSTMMLRHAFAAPSARLTAPALRPQTLLRRARPLAVQHAAFQTSSKRDILPPLPQRIEGTVNDAARLPGSDPMHGNYHWTMERSVASSRI